MSADGKKSMGGTLVLICLGIVALFAGVKSLVVLIPVAVVVYYGAGLMLRSGRN